MKAYLMHRNQDFDLEQPLPWNEGALTQDLELNTLFTAMSNGDSFLLDVARRAVLSGLDAPDAIVYRQHVLADCLEQPAPIRQMYEIAGEAVQAERKVWGFFAKTPDTILYRSVQVLELLVGSLKRLRKIADQAARRFTSEGFVRFFAMLSDELNDAYLQTLDAHLRELKFPRGALISAALGRGNKGTHYVLRKPREQRWLERIAPLSRSSYSFQLAERDESGFRMLGELKGRGINLVANALAQSTDHVVSFFNMLRAELAFYVGCLNLHERLREKGEPTCFPVPLAPTEQAFSAQGLYDVCLSLHLKGRAVGNDVSANNKSLVFITGANQGGKSTFLRSIGLAHLMMQSGAFVPAEALMASICQGVFTHFKREEDRTMKSGKLDEELNRASEIADNIPSHGLLLCNESFAATNEREGSEIARQIVRALTESGIRVFFVTHLFGLAHGFFIQHLDYTLFLRAERLADARRTFRLVEGAPLPTSHGKDAYERIFRAASRHVGDVNSQ